MGVFMSFAALALLAVLTIEANRISPRRIYVDYDAEPEPEQSQEVQQSLQSKQTGCTYKGVNWNNLATFPHDNGCAILQCQFGQVVTYYEACGKEIDGKCNRLNLMFVHQGNTYQCRKVPVGSGFELRNEIAFKKIENCEVEGKTYQHLDKLRRSRDCQEYQCQDGVLFPLDEGCGGNIDGKCHLVGEKYVKDGVTYNCVRRTENNIAIFEDKVIPTTSSSRSCTAGNRTLNHLTIFTNPDSCSKRQCYDRTITTLTYDCRFKQDEGKCYSIGEEWSFNGKPYSCTWDAANGHSKVVLGKVFGTCLRSEKEYNHLEIHIRVGGCTSVQCQDGKSPPVEEGCFSGADKCYSLNLIWDTGKGIKKCILTNDGFYRIVDVDENGNIIETPTATSAPPVFEETCPDLAADLIFVWDSSGSMSRPNFLRQLNFSCDIVSAFKIGPKNVQVGGVVFSDTAEKSFDLNTYQDFNSICKAIQSVPYLARFTETEKAFEVIVSEGMFTSTAGGRPDVPDIVIVITDGVSTNTARTVAAAGRVKALGAQIISLGVGQVSEDELKGIASRPENVFTIKNYDAIYSIRQELAERTCNIPTDPTEPPIVVPESTLCPKTVADVIFIIDSSSEAGNINYKNLLELSADLAETFSVSPKFVRIGEVLISSEPLNLFSLKTYSDVNSVSLAITESPYLKGSRDLHEAIELVLNEGLFTATHGGRDIAARVAFIILNGPPDWAKSLPLAKQLRNEGVRVFTIGIGSYPQKKLTGLSGNTEYVFTAPTFDLLEFTKPLMYQKACNVTNLPRPDPEPPRCTDTEELPCDHICQNIESGYVCSCKTGYVVNKQDKSKCDDKNECSGNADLCEQICENNVGSYQCLCKPGYEVNIHDPSKCTDINECNSNPCQNTCTNTEGSYKCSCNSGYQVSAKDPTTCEDIDECSKDSPCQHKCDNTDGGYTCSCKPGYVISATDPNKCEDIDECSKDSPCQHKCDNTDGGYTCSCKHGYVVSATDPNKCEDIDECSKHSPCQQICKNTDGGHTCSCKPGYVVSPTDSNKCEDIDECSKDSPCQQLCENTDGGHICSCKPGYVVSATDPSKCKDIDECSKDSPCQQLCENIDGGHVCSCKPGYVVSITFPDKCDDIDECGVSSPCEQTCHNKDNGFTCSCRIGYEISPVDPTKCIDIDECSRDSPCQHHCKNTDGRYTCSCKPGYVVNSADSNKCEDINECREIEPCQQKCSNMDGGYNCSCRPGYEVSASNPNLCEDIDECRKDSPCQQLCENTDGGYTCSCKPGYVVSATDPDKCDDVDQCGTSSPCEQICHNTDGGFSCSCRPGYTINDEDPTRSIDRCGISSPCEQICTNTEGGFACSCRHGYKINDEDPTTCDDVNECCEIEPCQQICRNTDGGYSCSCRPGYEVSASNPNLCEAVDQCGISSPCEHICTNTNDGFACSCRPGYTINDEDPTTCDDINECRKIQPCQQYCHNTNGGYNCSCRPGYEVSATNPNLCEAVDQCGTSSPCEQLCLPVVCGFSCFCRPGYRINDEDPTTCDDINECREIEPCQQICHNRDGGYSCSCRPGYKVSASDPHKCEDDQLINPSTTEPSVKCECIDGTFIFVPHVSLCPTLQKPGQQQHHLLFINKTHYEYSSEVYVYT